MSTVNFSLGDDFGILIRDVAREKIIYNHDGQKAVDVITDSLIGCPEDIALDIIFGSKVIEVVGPGDVEVVDVKAADYSYFEDVFEYHLLEMTKQADEWLKALDRFDEYNKVHSGIIVGQYIPSDDIFKMCFDDVVNSQQVVEDIIKFNHINYDYDEYNVVEDIYDCSKCIKRLFNELNEILNVTNWIIKKRPGVIPEGFGIMPDAFRFLKIKIDSLCVRHYYAPSPQEFITLDNEDANEHELYVPVDITNGYDGGWLSPDGKFYGMYGDYCMLIHMTIADALVKHNVITIPSVDDGFYQKNPEAWLSAKGWVKIHHDNVLYDGYMWGEEFVHMTEAQIEQIVRYGIECYGNYLTFGPERNRRSMIQFQSIDKYMLYKLFDYDTI